MNCNEGSTDRVIRIILGAALLASAFLWLGLLDSTILGVGAGAIGAVLVVTGIAGYCPAYKICGMSTCAVKQDG